MTRLGLWGAHISFVDVFAMILFMQKDQVRSLPWPSLRYFDHLKLCALCVHLLLTQASSLVTRHFTITLPSISGWMLHQYRSARFGEGVAILVAFLFEDGRGQTFGLLVVSWMVSAVCVQVTLVPTATVIVLGSNAKSTMLTWTSRGQWDLPHVLGPVAEGA